MSPEKRRETTPLRMRPDAIEEQIRDAEARGEFADLPGKGKPLAHLDDDPLWWVKEKLRREQVSFVPEALQLRKDIEDAMAALEATRSESRAREILERINERIREVNRRTTSGPPSDRMPLDVEEHLGRWRSGNF